MAAGTVVSRMSGFVRAALLAAALGQQLHADVFNIANTIPNMLYILLAGGIFNAVLVPQLVRAMRHDADGGDGLHQPGRHPRRRCSSAVVTVVAGRRGALGDAAVPRRRTSRHPSSPTQRESVIAFARYCLPQVFFYGMFVLVGQILNARGRFGPMMWAPIANNVISVGGAGRLPGRVRAGAEDLLRRLHPAARSCCSASARRSGIVAQFADPGAVPARGRLPLPRRASTSATPAWATPCGSGLWTVLFVIVNQIAYTVVVRLASSGTASSAPGLRRPGHRLHRLLAARS